MKFSLQRYQFHLEESSRWLLKSIRADGGSSAYFSPLSGWSKSYPETSGYLVPTLATLAIVHKDEEYLAAATKIGKWLLSIQDEEGYWRGGAYPYKSGASASLFNSGQILIGLCSLHSLTNDDTWLQSAKKVSNWFVQNLDANGIWTIGHYRGSYQPSYYTRIAWPLLTYAKISGDESAYRASIRVLDWALNQQLENAAFRNWGFDEGAMAFTHTIAYTIRGLLESALLLDDWENYGAPAATTLERMTLGIEINSGKPAGRYDAKWQEDRTFNCLTGCSQLAICYLLVDEHERDLRLVNTASKLVDEVCRSQTGLNSLLSRGGIPGSNPFWGAYMAFRFPNWATKFHVDALCKLMLRLDTEYRDA